MTVLITGASGLVGTECVEVMSAAGVDLVCAGRAPVGALPHVRWDMTEPIPAAALPERIDAVVHLAKSACIRDVPEAAGEIFGIDVAAAVSLATAASGRGATRFVYASSGAAGQAGELPAGAPLAYYAAVKRAGELVLGALMPTVALRLHFPYSARRPCFVRNLAERIRDGRPVPVAGGEGPLVNPITARDAAQAVLRALDHPPAVIDVAGPETVSVRALAERLGQQLGTEPAFEVDPPAEAPAAVGDHAQTLRLLGRPATSLDDGLRALADGLEPSEAA